MLTGKTILLRSTLGWSLAAILSVPGSFFLHIPGFSNMIAAQITVGITGLAGGLSYASLFRSMGGKISRKQAFYLAAVWALSLMLGVTMTFLVSGPPPKMMVLTFYSFTAWGALGGFVTARILHKLFAAAAKCELPPSLTIWSVSLGVAVTAADASSEYLRAFLPAWLAWVLAYEAMALLIGFGGGIAVIQLFRTQRKPKGSSRKYLPGITAEADQGERITVLVLLCLPFYLNDFADINVSNWRIWLSIDYTAVKLFPLLMIGWLLRAGKMKPAEFGLTPTPAITFWTVFLIGTIAGLFLEQNGYAIIAGLPGNSPLGGMPKITSPFWSWFDLTAGLLLVGISEEVVFRGYLCTFLSRYTRRASIIIGIAALAFGLIHWSGGLHKVMVTAVVGAFFMALYLKTRSIFPFILSHFTINFISFSGIVPQSIFRCF